MLKTRILTSLVLVSALLAALFLLPDIYWALLLLIVITMGSREWAMMTKLSPVTSAAYVFITACMGFIFLFASGGGLGVQSNGMNVGLLAGSFFWLVLVPVWLISRYHIKNRLVMAITGWLVIMPAWLALVALHAINPWLLLGILVAVWIADIAAYFTGKRFGKHKLAVFISPGKTWEGVFGAWLAVSFYGLCICLIRHLDFWFSVGVIAALWAITVLSIVGDLFESLIKRQASVKDSGSLLPGHGGVLDRIDGLTSSLPVVTSVGYIISFSYIMDHL
jgi:phosphatidate cytidylyltransferase